jgi:hypothetical protein
MTTCEGAVYLTGGRQKPRKADEWRQFEQAVILRLEPASGSIQQKVAYASPPEFCPGEDPSFQFKAAIIEGNRLYTCTNTEVLIYEVPGFRLVHRLSLPCFNDLHYARPAPGGNLYVVVTGLDMLVEVTLQGDVLREWPMAAADPWQRFSRSTDYRKVPTTKPHAAHPNFVTPVGGDLWVSRAKQEDVICVTQPDRRVQFCASPHDGVRHNGRVYFTTVNGFIYILNEQTMAVEQCIDLNALDQRESALGWVRGILPLDGNLCWVGFTRLRPTRFKENLSWLRRGLRRYHLPTRVALYDLARKELCREFDTEPHGLNAIFSILPEPAIPQTPSA